MYNFCGGCGRRKNENGDNSKATVEIQKGLNHDGK
jgi:hypothetical protein